MRNYFFYKIFLPIIIWLINFKNTKKKYFILNKLINLNNKIVLNSQKNKARNVLILLPRCLQYFDCSHNIISSVENCKSCGKCKIKDIIKLSEKYCVNLKVAPGGSLAKVFIKQINPDYIIAVACWVELMLGIKEVYPYKVLAVANIIVNQPCINTDVKVEEIEDILQKIV